MYSLSWNVTLKFATTPPEVWARSPAGRPPFRRRAASDRQARRTGRSPSACHVDRDARPAPGEPAVRRTGDPDAVRVVGAVEVDVGVVDDARAVEDDRRIAPAVEVVPVGQRRERNPSVVPLLAPVPGDVEARRRPSEAIVVRSGDDVLFLQWVDVDRRLVLREAAVLGIARVCRRGRLVLPLDLSISRRRRFPWLRVHPRLRTFRDVRAEIMSRKSNAPDGEANCSIFSDLGVDFGSSPSSAPAVPAVRTKNVARAVSAPARARNLLNGSLPFLPPGDYMTPRLSFANMPPDIEVSVGAGRAYWRHEANRDTRSRVPRSRTGGGSGSQHRHRQGKAAVHEPRAA